MIDEILKFLTKRKQEMECGFCKKKFIGETYKAYYRKLGNVISYYCSKKCEKAMHKAIKKCFNRKELTKQEKEATKNLKYVDF